MDCPHIPEITADAFGERLYARIAEQQVPVGGTIELTSRCNLNCVHCFINLPAGDRDAISREMTTGQVEEIIDQAVDSGLLFLTLTGGEIFLREDLKEIYRHAKERGVLVTLFSNGTLITPEMADFLAEWPPLSVEITLYGRTQETYESVTRVAGSFKRCMQGIALFVDRDLPVRLKTTVLTLNQHELWDIKEFAEELTDRPFRYDPMIHPRRGDGSRGPTDYRLSPQQIVELERQDNQRIEELAAFYQEYGGSRDAEARYLCGAGLGGFHVDPSGQMRVCLMSCQHGYDLLSGNLKQGWREWLPRELAQKPTQWSACRECDLIALCTNCPAWGESTHGASEIIPIDFLCQLAHLRANEFCGRSHER